MLPSEPLIFVEVALLPQMPRAIAPLLDRQDPVRADAQKMKVAVFYSISNCQPGLRGVNLGNFLIKRVVEQLRDEFPNLKTFCTLSPVPGFAHWLSHVAEPADPRLKPAVLRELHTEMAAARERLAFDPTAASPDDVDQQRLARLCAWYLSRSADPQAPQPDPVARFHLNNGARLERINPLADLSRKGLKQSHGVMVNYLYDLEEIEANHERFVNGEVSAARAVTSLI